ncbi:MAG: hypothetical protein NC344_00460 [Bacteroidales bacterium]|nr:hypothetical protein [Bacteroidales bacterium]MCM1146308.1 hypothetical protein [Bacteroidales bacterium]MCM1205254.1 hypothetical protein [Bacillota bacterium]MCM1509661.1 hypothetical protein [Clostridium sp.]
MYKIPPFFTCFLPLGTTQGHIPRAQDLQRQASWDNICQACKEKTACLPHGTSPSPSHINNPAAIRHVMKKRVPQALSYCQQAFRI